MICVSLGKIGLENALEYCRSFELVELRADLLNLPKEELLRLMDAADKLVFTCRPEYGNDNERLDLFSAAVEQGADYIDVELESAPGFISEIRSLCENTRTRLILSYHNYQSTPGRAELAGLYEECFRKGGELAKIAVFINSDRDVVNLFSLYEKEGAKIILGMGEKGVITRVAAVPMGSEFSFASPGDDNSTAPGQISYRELQTINSILGVK